MLGVGAIRTGEVLIQWAIVRMLVSAEDYDEVCRKFACMRKSHEGQDLSRQAFLQREAPLHRPSTESQGGLCYNKSNRWLLLTLRWYLE